MTFIDDFSKKNFRNLVENQTENKIKKFRSDNGTEYINEKMKKVMLKNGYVHQTTVLYNPEQNGTAERMNRSLLEKARCMMYEANLSKKFWAEAANTAVYLVNVSPATSTGKTPEEVWSGKAPDLSHLRVFGCLAYNYIPKQKRLKLDAYFCWICF